MAEAPSVIYVWSPLDEKLWNINRKTVCWLMIPILLIGLVMLAITAWAYFELGGCGWRVAPSSAGPLVLTSFLALSLLVILLAIVGLFVFTIIRRGAIMQYIRVVIIFVLLTLGLMVAVWIYTCYWEYNWYGKRLLLTYLCIEEVAKCWDEIQKKEVCGTNSNKSWIPPGLAFTEGCRDHFIWRSLIHILVVTVCWVIVFVIFLIVCFFAIHILRGLNIRDAPRMRD